MRFLISLAHALVVLTMSSATALAADVETLPGPGPESHDVARNCLNDLEAFDTRIARTGFGELPLGGDAAAVPSSYYVLGVQGTPRQKIRLLREAAYVYALDGDEASCQVVLASMEEVYDQYLRLLRPEADDPNVRRAWRRAHLSETRPVGEMHRPMRAKVLVGSELRNLQDEKLGVIEDLVLDPKGRDIAYVLVSRGGFLGLGTKLVAVRWGDLRATEDHELYVLDAPETALENAPQVDSGNYRDTGDPGWRESLSSYWDGVSQP